MDRPRRSGWAVLRHLAAPALALAAVAATLPTTALMDQIGLEVTSVGNHEFDEGVAELLRLNRGGCHPTDGCQDGDGFAGADFTYLAANVVYKSNGQTIFPAYTVKNLNGAKIGF